MTNRADKIDHLADAIDELLTLTDELILDADGATKWESAMLKTVRGALERASAAVDELEGEQEP